jgi:hypothetical protein
MQQDLEIIVEDTTTLALWTKNPKQGATVVVNELFMHSFCLCLCSVFV